MCSADSRNLIGRATGVLAALLACSLFAPSRAQASCGDYVVLGDHKAASTHSHTPMAGDQPATPDSSRKGHLPCSGPHCSRGSLPSPVVPAPPAPPSSESWGCLPSSRLQPDPDFNFRLVPTPSPQPLRRASSIFHPPRLSSVV